MYRQKHRWFNDEEQQHGEIRKKAATTLAARHIIIYHT